MPYLFVYGTLRRPFATPLTQVMQRYCVYIGEASFQGKLYGLDGYPGVVASADPHDRVQGEVYRILNATALFPILDTYEECTPAFTEPHEYRRRLCWVRLRGGGRVSAWVYLFNHSVAALTPIASGDYVGFSRN